MKNLQTMTQARQMLTAPHLIIDGKKVTPKRSHYQAEFEAAAKANKLLLPVQTSDAGTGEAMVVASNDNRNINTHHGDFVFPKLDVNHSDSTARAFTEYRMA